MVNSCSPVVVLLRKRPKPKFLQGELLCNEAFEIWKIRDCVRAVFVL